MMTVKELKSVFADLTNVCINIGPDKNNFARLHIDHGDYDNATVKEVIIVGKNSVVIEVKSNV